MQRTFTTAFLAVLLALAAPAQAPQNDTTPAGEAAAPAPTPLKLPRIWLPRTPGQGAGAA